MNEIFGNTTGLKPSELKSLQHLYRRRIPADSFITPEVVRTMTELSRETNRQLGLMIDRTGAVTHVIVGDAHKLFLPDFGRERAGKARFRGLRLILTHLQEKDHLGVGITEADVVLEQLGAIRGEHQTGVQHASVVDPA